MTGAMTMVLKNKNAGVLSILAASIMWGIEPILAKLSYQTTDYIGTFATRIIFCFGVVAAYLLLRRKNPLAVSRRQFHWLVYLSFAATLFADLMYTYALTRVPVINAVLIGHMQPLFIVVLGFLVLRSDRLTAYDYAGIAAMICAGVLVTTKSVPNMLALKFGSAGDAFVLAATVAWATTAIVTRKYLRELDAGVVAFYRFLFAGALFTLYVIVTRGLRIVNPYQVILGIAIGIGTVFYYEGLKRIKAAQVAALELSTPFFATVLGILVLREYIIAMQGIGLLLLVIGIYLLSRKENQGYH
jgi:drug/metabolite transporter (DMT)-like permease